MSRQDDDSDRTESMGESGDRPDRPRIERLGQFKIEATLGSGGMGTIYRAYDESMKRTVALKVLHSSLEISDRAQSRFVREAWIVGQLDHPNIIRVFSRGEENNVSYLAMELAEGGSLYDFIKDTQESIPSGSDITDTIDQDYINAILGKFVELAGALDHIHSKGFIHRDIKPHNVLLSGEDKKFKFTDFGIAHAEDMTRMTKAGDFIGTVKYMSPELLAAHRAGIDRRTDIYSLGVTLYEALTLTLPFRSDSEEKLIGEILAGHYTEARKSNRRIPYDLETVLMKACHHDPDQRYQTAAEFAEDLQRIIDGRPTLAKRQSLFSKAVKYCKRNYKMVLGIAAALTIVTGTVIWAYYKTKQASRIESDQQAVIQIDLEPEFTKIDIPGLTEYCALSPDGERIAFVAEDGCLWVAPTHGPFDPGVIGEPTKLTGPLSPNTWSSFPVWSADGQWIAFNGKGTSKNRWADSMAMFVVSSTRGDPTKLPVEHDRWDAHFDLRIGLSPGGEEIAFFSHTSPIESDPLKNCIYSIPVGGGEIKRLAGPNCGQPAYSPDGKMLAYIKGDLQPWALGDSLYSDVWIMSIDGGGGSPIQVSDMPGMVYGPVWSPDSRKLIFGQWHGQHGEYGISTLYVAQLSETYELIGSPSVIDLPMICDGAFCSWSEDNKIGLTLVSTTGRDGAIYKVPVSGGIATKASPTGAYFPKWSPDSDRIFYLNEPDSICSISAMGGSEITIPITKDADNINNFDLSPDGKNIASAIRRKGDSTYSIHVSSIDNANTHQLTAEDSISYYEPCWSPDGKWIAFFHAYNYKQWHLSVIPAEGGHIRDIVSLAPQSSLISVTWSPNSKVIAYTSYSDDSLSTISTVPLEGGDPDLKLVLPSYHVASAISWSPDGSRLCYGAYRWNDPTDYSSANGDIWILPLDIGIPVKLQTGLDLEEISGVDWSPDGSYIAFSCNWGYTNDFYLMENFLPPEQRQKAINPPEPTFTTVEVPGLLDYCAVSPNGERIAFVANDTCLWVAPTRGPANPTVAGEPVKLAGPLGASPRFCKPTWSANGNWLAFNAWEFDSNSSFWSSMYVIPSSGGEITEVPAKHDRLNWGSFYDFRLSLSPKGKEIAFFSHSSPVKGDSGKDCIYSVPVKGGEIRKLASPLCEHAAYCSHPAYSPDGKMIAFLRGNQNCDLAVESASCDIWVVPVGGGSPIQVTDTPGVEFGPVWSPDSRKIAFSHWTEMEGGGPYDIRKLSVISLSESYEPIGTPAVVDLPLPSDDFIGGWSTNHEIGLVLETQFLKAIYTIPASGGIPTMIRPPTSRRPSWSPNGEKIYYVGVHDVYSVPANGGQESLIPISGFSDMAFDGGCDISPNGNELAISQEVEGDSVLHIYTISTEGGKPNQITFGLQEDWHPRWSPDGNWIAFARYNAAWGLKSQQGNLCIVPAGGGDVKILVPWTDSCGFDGGGVDWSPDGRFIAYPSFCNDSIKGISVLPIDGGSMELLLAVEPMQIVGDVRWSPDGSKIAYSVGDHAYLSGIASLWILPLDTRKPSKLKMIGYKWDWAFGADWSPDGKKIVFEGRQPPKNTLCLIKDFLPDELVKR